MYRDANHLEMAIALSSQNRAYRMMDGLLMVDHW